VTFSYGRRGATLRTGTKTQKPVSLEKAETIYNKLIKDKMAKGYTSDESGTPYVGTKHEAAHSGVTCQLLNPITEAEALSLCQNDAYCLQEKKDGDRQLVQMDVNQNVLGINRRGLYVGLAQSIVDAIIKLKGFNTLDDEYGKESFLIDCEGMGDYNHVFDLLECDGEDLKGKSYKERYEILTDLLSSETTNTLRTVPTAFSTKNKLAMYKKYKTECREGVVFKRLDAPYSAGRPTSGGSQLKHKFYETCSVIVTEINDKRSVQYGYADIDAHNSVGSVTIPPNHKVPQLGDVIEVRYLYAMPKTHALYQPTYLGKRTDVMPYECVIAQLKYKAKEV